MVMAESLERSGGVGSRQTNLTGSRRLPGGLRWRQRSPQAGNHMGSHG